MSKQIIQRTVAVLGSALGVLLLAMGPAAASVVTTPSNPVPVSAGQTSVPLKVSWSGLPTSPSSPSGRRLFITECQKSPADPTFQFAFDCSNLSEETLNPDQNVTGSGTADFQAFHGAEPSGDQTWGCFAPGETPPAGITALTTCYIRVTQDAESNTSDQQYSPLTFSVTTAVTPETSHVILLPLIAGLVIAGGFGVSFRRRRSAH